jgi:hypothetical protein
MLKVAVKRVTFSSHTQKADFNVQWANSCGMALSDSKSVGVSPCAIIRKLLFSCWKLCGIRMYRVLLRVTVCIMSALFMLGRSGGKYFLYYDYSIKKRSQLLPVDPTGY